MKLLKICSALLFTAGVATASVSAQPADGEEKTAASEPLEFSIRDDRFSYSLPEGYCTLSGLTAVVSRERQARDPGNLTPLNIQRCGTNGSDYILIKSPRSVPPLPLPREAFLDLLEAELRETYGTPDSLDGQLREVEEAMEETVQFDQAKIYLSGRDEHCAYLTGRIRVANETGQSVVMEFGSCGTLVGQRHIFIHAYAAQSEGVSPAELMRRSKELLIGIEPL